MKQAQIDPIEFDRAIECQLPEWRRLYGNAKLLDRISTKEKKKAVVKDLEGVHDFLTQVSPLFRIDRRIPTMEIKINGGFHEVRLTDLLGNGLLWAIDWLNNKRPKSGPHASNGVVTQAAYELSEMSRKFGGKNKTDWEWVHKKIQECFPECGTHKIAWIRDRVKKFKKGRWSKYREAGDLRPFPLSVGEKTNIPAVPATVDRLNSFFMRLAITSAGSVMKNWHKRPLRGKKRMLRGEPEKWKRKNIKAIELNRRHID